MDDDGEGDDADLDDEDTNAGERGEDILKPADEEERDLWRELETMWDPPDFPGGHTTPHTPRTPKKK